MMNLNDYFDPVGIAKDNIRNVSPEDEFSHKMAIHTPDFPIGNMNTFDVAIIGVPEERNARVKGPAKAPDLIRQKLYALGKIENRIRIADLGNMKQGNEIKDTYAGLTDVVSYLLSHDVIPVVLGGSQDLTVPLVRALQATREPVHLITADSQIDLDKGEKKLSSDSYLSTLIRELRGKLRYVNLGYQEYLISQRDLKFLHAKGHETIRLSDIRNNIPYYEAYIRDAEIFSVDLSSVRQGEAPGTTHPSPGGFTVEEICQLSRYAGLSQYQNIFAVFEAHPEIDRYGQTMSLAAQMIWYFLSGLGFRKKENPGKGGSRFTEYIISMPDTEYKLVFRKSEETGRWWLKIPDQIKPKGERTWIACSYEDYQMATHHELSPRWLNLFR